jgi:hypothetical protein
MLLGMRIYRYVAALALGLGALAAPAQAFAEDDTKGQTESGFALEASIGARFGVIAAGEGAGALVGNSPQTGLFAGYKSGRIILGLGLDFINTTSNTTVKTGIGNNMTLSTTTSDSDFLIGPEFQFAILQSPDKRVELIGDLSLHFGHQFHSVSVSPTPPPDNAQTDSNFLLNYAIGPGVRFWPHHHLAIQALTGFGGQAFFDLPVNGNPATGNNSQHGILASFGLIGVF